MRAVLLIIILCFFCPGIVAQDVSSIDYEQIYRDLPVPEHQYVHGIDPGEPFDVKQAIWSPYPLFRLTSPLFFKTVTIQPGYYLLTPREHEGKWYILFKEAGVVKYIIPVYDTGIVPELFYYENLPKPKLTFTQKFQFWGLDWIGKHSKDSRRKPIPQTFLEATDLDNNFVSLVIYWGNYRYYTILRTIQL
ncbi:MAG: hypothetical protein LBK53_06995 [Heliobacteriaceae bacterium]|jgi:hypothetical protein|nr:hypothetical protein [Heliobacteriaceae bacterium]